MEQDFYAVLNLPRNCSSEDIKQAYRRMCMAFHPDKQLDSSRKEATERNFQLIQKAYDILFDKEKRKIYDEFGYEGIQLSMQVGPHLNMAETIKSELERIKSKQEEFTGTLGVKSSTNAVAYIDASNLLDSYGLEGPSKYLPEIHSMSLQQSFQKQIDHDSSVEISLHLNSRNGNGDVGYTGTYKKRIYDFSDEIIFGGGSNDYFALNSSKPISKNSWLQSSFQSRYSYPLDPTYRLHLGRLLGKSYVGVVGFTLNQQKSVDLTFKRIQGVYLWNCGMRVSRGSAQVNGKVSVPLNDKLAIKLKGSFGSAGLHFGIGASWRLAKKASVSVLVETGTIFGAVLKISFVVGSNSIVLPVFFSHEFSPKATLIAALVPLVSVPICKCLVVDPIIKSRDKLDELQLKNARAEMFDSRKNEALEAIDIMRPIVEKKIAEEEKKNGLVIIEALYGINDQESVDARIPLQFLVNESKLLLHPHSKSLLLGMYDPFEGQEKTLKITYKFKSSIHKITISDEDSLVIPLRSHFQE